MVQDTVDIGVAAQVAANFCGVQAGPIAVLSEDVDRSGSSRTFSKVDRNGTIDPAPVLTSGD